MNPYESPNATNKRTSTGGCSTAVLAAFFGAITFILVITMFVMSFIVAESYEIPIAIGIGVVACLLLSSVLTVSFAYLAKTLK